MALDWAASALRWWQEAGVDVIVGEEPRDWLNPAPKPVAPAPSAPDREPLPSDLAAFQAWLMESEALPLAAPTSRRVGPAGDPGSGLMILVDMPSVADVGAGALLSGEVGGLFDKMMAAIGRSRETLYLAPLSPVRTPTGRPDETALAALAEIARHHVGLVAPKSLLLFGDACAKALVGASVAAGRGRWHELPTAAGPIKTLVTLRPEKLLTQPKLKKHAWEDLKRLQEGLNG